MAGTYTQGKRKLFSFIDGAFVILEMRERREIRGVF